jgi:large subunit ribosomal protein L18
MRTEQKHNLALKRRWRIRQKISGTKDRPRMSVCFTNKNIHVQFIDDTAGATIAAASTRPKAAAAASAPRLRANAAGAKALGAQAAQVALGKGIKQVVFDRGGSRYHGKVKALADAAREAGLKF